MRGAQLFKLSYKSVADATATKVTGNQSAPSLMPVGAGDEEGVIDVVSQFQWTASLKEKYIREETPTIHLKEYEVVGNAIVQQAKYMAEFGVNFVKEGVSAGGVAAGVGGAVVGGLLGGKQGAIYGAVAGAMAGSKRNSAPDGSRNKGYLEAYKGLYNVRPTGFKYLFPYFEEQFRSVTTQWGGPKTSSSPIGGMVNDVRGAVRNVLSDAALTLNEPNAFIEEAKAYEHQTMGNAYPVRFELSNTGTYEDVVRNWHLMYMLLYQNMGNRSSKVLVRPPCIYEVEIPGILYHPFCHLSNVSVRYKGASRKMKIDVRTITGSQATGDRSPGQAVSGTEKNNPMETVIPDAYELTMNVQPLVAEVKNMAFHTTSKNDGIYDVKVRDKKGDNDT